MRCLHCNQSNAVLKSTTQVCWDHVRCNEIAMLKKEPSKLVHILFEVNFESQGDFDEYMLYLVQDLHDADAINVLDWLQRHPELGRYVV